MVVRETIMGKLRRPDFLSLLWKIGSYGIVSVFCFLLNNALLIGLDALHQPLIVSLLVSASILIVVGFLLQAKFTFESPLSWSAFGRYTMMMLPNVPLAYGLLWLLNELLLLPMYYAAPIATTLLVVWNFVGSFWALRRRRTGI